MQFDVKVLNDAVEALSDAGKAELSKVITMFEEMKEEVAKLAVISDSFESLSVRLQKENDALKERIRLSESAEGESLSEL